MNAKNHSEGWFHWTSMIYEKKLWILCLQAVYIYCTCRKRWRIVESSWDAWNPFHHRGASRSLKGGNSTRTDDIEQDFPSWESETMKNTNLSQKSPLSTNNPVRKSRFIHKTANNPPQRSLISSIWSIIPSRRSIMLTLPSRFPSLFVKFTIHSGK